MLNFSGTGWNTTGRICYEYLMGFYSSGRVSAKFVACDLANQISSDLGEMLTVADIYNVQNKSLSENDFT